MLGGGGWLCTHFFQTALSPWIKKIKENWFYTGHNHPPTQATSRSPSLKISVLFTANVATKLTVLFSAQDLLSASKNPVEHYVSDIYSIGKSERSKITDLSFSW